MKKWLNGSMDKLRKHWVITAFFVALVLFAMMPGNLERFFIYYPTQDLEGDPSSIHLPFQDVTCITQDGIELHGWFIPHPNARVSLLIFHGNAGNISHRLPWIELLYPMEVSIWIIDYRGYGKSAGTPYEKGLYMDADAAYDWWSKNRGHTGEKLVLLGESLGGAVAVDLASRSEVSGLILQSTFTSARDMAKSLFPLGLLRPLAGIQFDSASKIGRIQCPKLIIHGDRDEIVPFRLGKGLFDLAPGPKEFYEVPGAGHNDLVWVGDSLYLQRLRTFLVEISSSETGSAGMDKAKGRQSRKQSRISIPSLALPEFAPEGLDSRKWLHILLITIAVVYLLTFSSVPISTLDDQLMLTSAMFFVETGKFTAPSRFATKKFGLGYFGHRSTSGEVYPKYTSGYPMVLAVFIVIAGLSSRIFGSLMADLILCLPSILFLLAVVVLIWRAAIRLGMDSSAANLAAIGLGLGSFAWPYAGINFSEPCQMFCILASLYCLLAAWQHNAHWWKYAGLGGLALAYAIWVKPVLGVLAPIFVLGALFEWRRRIGFRQAFGRSTLFAAPGVLTSVFILGSNFLIFGDASNFGYAGESFTTPLVQGFIGLTLGWARGIVWFAPLVVLAPWGFVCLIKRSKVGPALVMGSAVIIYLALLSKWHGFGGGHCWGPRLLMPILPLLIILAVGAMDLRWSRWIGCALIAAGIFVNSLGALVNYQAYYIAARSAKKDYLPGDPAFNQIRCHLWLLRVQTKALFAGKVESDLPLWENPPWIGQYKDAIPPPYSRNDQPILNSWPLRLALPESRWQRNEIWYLRAILEVAIFKYEQEDLPGAMNLLDEGLRLDPNHKELIAAKGLIYYSLKSMQRALRHFSQSLKLDPNYELGLYGVGLVMEALGKQREAYLAYARLMKLPLRTLDREEIRTKIKALNPR